MRIIMLGNTGAGKSTMTRRIIGYRGIPRLSLDQIAWNEGPERKPLEESLELLREFIEEHDQWIIEGCYGDLIEAALLHCTELRFLNPGVETCIQHCRKRPWEPEKFETPEAQQAMLDDLIAWAREYETRDDEYGLKRHRKIFDEFVGSKIEFTDAKGYRDPKPSHPRWPLHGWLGLLLVAVFWILNWSLPGLRTHLCFFPMWLGYCLTVDALVVLRRGNSLLTRSLPRYAVLFLVSIPAWWLFELLNLITENWYYNGAAYFTDLEYALLASLSFSTVIPAVFGTAELIGSFEWIDRFRRGRRLPRMDHAPYFSFFLGCVLLFYMYLWPYILFPVMWLSVFFMLDPINYWCGFPSILRDLGRGDWRTVMALFTGCLICGFFWEMWNHYSYPHWCYEIPYFDFCRIFKMPLLGYLGYLPFSLELFAMYNLVMGLIVKGSDRDYVRIA